MNIELVEYKQFNEIASVVEEVQDFHAHLFPRIYKQFDYDGIKAVMEQMITDKNCKLWIAKENGKTIAYLLLMIKSIEDNAFHYALRILHIDQIAVLKTHQHSGVGSILLEKAEELARDLSIFRLELDHLALNSVAADFFASKGFQPYRNKLCKLIK